MTLKVDESLRCLPRVAYPDILHCLGRQVAILVQHGTWEMPLLRLILVVQHEDGEGGTLPFPSELCAGCLNVLLQFPDSVLERCPSIVYLVHNQDVFADKCGHLQAAKVEPLRASDFGAGRLNWIITAELLV